MKELEDNEEAAVYQICVSKELRGGLESEGGSGRGWRKRKIYDQKSLYEIVKGLIKQRHLDENSGAALELTLFKHVHLMLF